MNYLNESYSSDIYDTPLTLVDLIAKLYSLLITAFGVVILIPASSLSIYHKVVLAVLSLLLLILHLFRRHANPHLFHSPQIPSLSIPLNESIRTSPLYICLSTLYLAYVILSLCHIVQPLNEYIHQSSLSYSLSLVFIYSAVVIFCLTSFVCLPEFIKKYRKKGIEPNQKRFLLEESGLIVLLSGVFIYLLFVSSVGEALYRFGNVLLGSISLMLAKDLFIGKWTHQVPTPQIK